METREKSPLISSTKNEPISMYSTIRNEVDIILPSKGMDLSGPMNSGPGLRTVFPVAISWDNINVFAKAKTGDLPNWLKRKAHQTPAMHILKDVSGSVEPGQLLAIMGASGAGKSTLLNVLTGWLTHDATIEGVVRLNGREADLDDIKAYSAYVHQDDLFLQTLTVREHLVFQAMLRMGKQYSKDEKLTRVSSTIIEMGLAKSSENMIRNLSGGERKRLALASELLTDASIILCDEPTSGLDSFSAEHVVQLLQYFAKAGRTVICSIHQPSSEIFSLFSRLLLMADGRVAFLGEPSEAMNLFNSVGLFCPPSYNPADFFVQELALRPEKEPECRKKIQTICEAYHKHDAAKNDLLGIRRPRAPSSFSKRYKETKSVYQSSSFTQFYYILKRSFINTKREPKVTFYHIFEATITAIMIGLIFYGQHYTQVGITNINGAMFKTLMLISNRNMVHASNTFCTELPLFFREHKSAIYRVGPYYWAKTTVESWIYIFYPLWFNLITYYMIGMSPGFVTFCQSTLVLILSAMASTSVGYVVASACPSHSIASSITTILAQLLSSFGGFFLSTLSVPIYFIWLQDISWFDYASEAMTINQWEDVKHISCVDAAQPSFFNTNKATFSSNVTQVCPSFCLETGEDVIISRNFRENRLLVDCLLILAQIIGYRIVGFLALLAKTYSQ